MVTIAFYLIFFLSPISSNSLSSSSIFSLIQQHALQIYTIIKFFKLILNLDPKLIKPI